MKKILLCALISFFCYRASAQYYYPDIASYSIMATPVNGVKIKTNLPYTGSVQMPTILIKGYNYKTGEPIGLSLVWYVYNGDFIHYSASSSGAYTPEIKLGVENNKVVIYIDDRQYYQRFFVSAFAKMREQPSWFDGWTIVDEPFTGTNVVTLPYKNEFKGEITFPDGIWDANGNVGIGTVDPKAKLVVNGNILAKEVKVKTNISVPDYVFEGDYPLISLAELEQYIDKYKHLPEIPSAAEIRENGLELAKMNLLLLKKIEELTIHLIELEKKCAVAHSQAGSSDSAEIK